MERGPSSEDPLDEAVANVCFMKRCEKAEVEGLRGVAASFRIEGQRMNAGIA